MTTVLHDKSDLKSIVSDVANQIQQIDYEPVMTASLDRIAEIERDAFDAGRSPDGDVWLPDAKSTVNRKKQGLVLVASGVLERSLIEVGAEGNVHETSPHGLLFGTSVPYSIFNQTGSSREPARPHVSVNEAFADELAAEVGDFVVDQLKRGN